MKKIFFLLLCLFVLMGPAGFATAPTSMSLSFNMSKSVLHVEAVHPTFDLEKSYVRIMNVYVNGQQVASQNYFKQNDYNKFFDDVSVTAGVGDVIKVELFCALGGEMSAELTVSADASANSITSENSAIDNSTTDNSSTTNSAADNSTDNTST